MKRKLTPRTDAVVVSIPCYPDTSVRFEVVAADFARKLERELADTVAEIQRLIYEA